MAIDVHPAVAVLVLAAVLLLGLSGSIAFTEATTGGDGADLATLELDDDRDLWLYTSASPSFEQPKLALNVLVYGDADRVQRLLVDVGDWEETQDEERDIQPAESSEDVNSTFVEWEAADGADRFVYLDEGESGRWLREDYQIHRGDYFGSRHHIRAYTPPDGANWTAMQAHQEYWDWFGSRHQVTSARESQRFLENEFIDNIGIDAVVRTHVGHRDPIDFDGWLTVVDLRPRDAASLVLLGGLLLGLPGVRRLPEAVSVDTIRLEQELRAGLLASAIVGVLLAIRFAGIGLERQTDVPFLVVAGLLYPLLFVGLPVAAYLPARQLSRSWAFAGASTGFALGLLLDMTYLGVTQLSLQVLVHRAGLAVALGLIAVGASRPVRHDVGVINPLRVGVLLWLVGMLLPMLRHTSLPV
ncbi:MAG: hypothetical protein ACOC0X_01715 [Halobacteriota archaeon]